MKKTRKKTAKAAKATGSVHAKSVEAPKSITTGKTEPADWFSGKIPRDEISEWKSYFVQVSNSEEHPMWLDGLFHATIDKVIVRQDNGTTGHVWIRFKIDCGEEEQPTYACGRWHFPEPTGAGDLHISELLRPWLEPEDMKAAIFDLNGQVGRKCQVVIRMHTHICTEVDERGYLVQERQAVPVVQLVLPSNYQPYMFRGLPRAWSEG